MGAEQRRQALKLYQRWWDDFKKERRKRREEQLVVTGSALADPRLRARTVV